MAKSPFYWLLGLFAGASPLDMEATLTTPSGKNELCEIRDSPGNLFTITFTPTENGVNVLSLKQKGIHIAGTSVFKLHQL